MTETASYLTQVQQFSQFVAQAARDAGYDIDSPRGGGKKELAEAAGMSAPSVSRMLGGQTVPDPRFFEGLAGALRIDTATLLVRSGLASEEMFRSTPRPAAVLPPARDLLGTVRRSPNGRSLAVMWPSPPNPHHWIVTDQWGSTGYETDAHVADWPVVGAVPYSPAAGMSLDGTGKPVAPVRECAFCREPIPADRVLKEHCDDRCRWADDDHGPNGDDQ